MKYEIVVGAVSNRDSARITCTTSPSIAAGSRSCERIAIVEQAMSSYGTAVAFARFYSVNCREGMPVALENFGCGDPAIA